MIIPPQYKIFPEMLRIISEIDSKKLFFESLEIPPLLKQKIERISLLKSSLFSAKIEGNPLNLDEVETSSDELKKKEVFNILSAQQFIEKEIAERKKIDKKIILKIHEKVMEEISSDAGHLRNEMGAIFNQAGIAVYLSPPPSQINSLLEKLFEYINSKNEPFPLIKAFISHLVFEKIHPFIDGNGRVGRLLISAVLFPKNYSFNIAIPFEEYLNEHKEEYYYYIDIGLKDPQKYLAFMLNAFNNQANKIKEELQKEMLKKDKIYLPPREDEIFNIIKDHKIIDFEQIRRRFLKVPERTLRFDLLNLAKKGLVKKVGRTRGSYYVVKETT